jgi:hypothetical protein
VAEEKKKDNRGGPRKNAGGRRPGAGRKPNFLKKLGLSPITAAQLMEHYDQGKLISHLLRSHSDDVKLRTYMFLYEQIHGKAKQAMHLNGGIGVAYFEASASAAVPSEDLDERIKQLEGELGLVPKPVIEAAVPQLPAPVAPAAQSNLPPSYHILKTPPGGVTNGPAVPVNIPAQSAECDKHGPFTPKSKWEPTCPSCKFEWEQQDRADKQRLNNLMPGEPLWSRIR